MVQCSRHNGGGARWLPGSATTAAAALWCRHCGARTCDLTAGWLAMLQLRAWLTGKAGHALAWLAGCWLTVVVLLLVKWLAGAGGQVVVVVSVVVVLLLLTMMVAGWWARGP